eukprot:3431330-Karenia_brevis.AAC.1
MMRTTINFAKAMNVNYAEGNETTIKTTRRLVEGVQSFLKNRVRGTSLGEADELIDNRERRVQDVSSA